MTARVSVEEAREWLARRVPAGLDAGLASGRTIAPVETEPPPAGVQRFGPGHALLADGPVAPARLRQIARASAATAAWLAGELGLASFPALLVHVDACHSLVPTAHLYPDGVVPRIALCHADVKTEHLVHELTHALAGVRDSWAGELLAYHVGFGGAGVLATAHRRALDAHSLTVEDVVRAGWESLLLLSDAASEDPPGLVYDPTNPYHGLLFLLVGERLRGRGGAPALRRYLLGVDRAGGAAEQEAFFAATFGTSRRQLLVELAATLGGEPPRAGVQGSDAAPPSDGPSLRAALRALVRSAWVDGFDLAYLRAAIATHGTGRAASWAAELLYLDYRLYRGQRAAGVRNSILLRALLRRSAEVLQRLPESTLALSVRYFLLTDHALDRYEGRMALLAEVDRPLADALRAIVVRLAQAADDRTAATLAHGHFHLFYPAALGADAALGQRLTQEVLAVEPGWEDAYVHLAAHHASRGDADAVERLIERYRCATAGDVGPSLLARAVVAFSRRRREAWATSG